MQFSDLQPTQVTCMPPMRALGHGREAVEVCAAMRDQTSPDSSTWLYLRWGKGGVDGKKTGKKEKKRAGKKHIWVVI